MKTSEQHFDHLLRLLKLESDAEATQIVERMQREAAQPNRGASTRNGGVRGLVVLDEEAALAGRVKVTLARRNQAEELPFNRLSVGSPVMLLEENVPEPRGQRGIVCYRDRGVLQLACQDLPEAQGERPTFRVEPASDEIARQRIVAALQTARSTIKGRVASLRDVLLGLRKPEFLPLKVPPEFSANINPSQQLAIVQALTAQDVAVIHGPPGTGKTTTLVELIRQAASKEQKILACAPSNLAVDNLVEKLVNSGVKAIRLGHPARVSPALQEHTLDLLVDAHPDVALARKLVRQADALQAKASKFTRAKPAPGARREMRDEARELRNDARRIEEQVVESLLDSAQVLCATLTGLDGQLLGDRRFEWVVIDEAAQATEPICWPAILRAERVVLAGDHCQLPPTIISGEAAKAGLAISLLERVVGLYGKIAAGRLEIQYRMHQQIMQFSSDQFYEGGLQAHEAVANHLLIGLSDVQSAPQTESPFQFIDTAGAGYDEATEPASESLCNPAEGAIVVAQVEQLLQAGVRPEQVGVISPYSAQVRWLRERLAMEGLEIDTVDGFQGREKEAIVVSLVRSNERGEIGFLSDVRRMNVALTRARRKLIVVGDSATLAGHPFYQQLLAYVEQIGAYQSVWELQ